MEAGSVPGASVAFAKPAASAGKARALAQDFEAQFLKTMLDQAYAGLDGEGPLGGGGVGAEAWRGLMIDEQAKAMAARGGIGLAAQVYREIEGRK